MNLGERIRNLRKSKNITQEELAKMIGVKRSVISKYENGSVNISTNNLLEISKALAIPIEAFLGNDIEITKITDENSYIKYVIEDNAGTVDDFPHDAILVKDVSIDKRNKLILKHIRQDTIAKYDSLNALGQKKANEYITDLSEQEKYTTPDEEKNPR